MPPNQNPEQLARDNIDALLRQSGWVIQNKNQLNLNAGIGQAVREYQTDTGPADYILFVDRKPVGVIEAKAEHHGHRITAVEDQTAEYAIAKLKWGQRQQTLTFFVRKHRRDYPFYRFA
jgi:type I restriction enzyme, R subunit